MSEPGGPNPPAQPPRVWRHLWNFVHPYRLKILLTFLLALLVVPLSLIAPWPLRIAVDSIIGKKPMPAVLAGPMGWFGLNSVTAQLLTVAALLIAITLLMHVQGLLSWRAQTWLGEKISLDVRAALFRHAQRLSLRYHEREGTTDSVYRIQNDAQSLQSVLVNGLMPLATSAFSLCGMVIVTAEIDREMAMVALLVCPVLYLITVYFNRRLHERWCEVRDLDSSAMNVVQETLTSIRVVKAFGREEHEHQRFINRSGERFCVQIDVARIQGNFDLVIGLTIAVGTAVVLMIGVLHARAGTLTTGQLLVVMAYLAQIYEPLKTISKKVADLQSGLVSAERALALLDELPDVRDRSRARPLKRARGHFRFEGVNFGYEPGRLVLSDLNLDIPAGSRVGIQGTTGAGKTTLVSLLSRFYDPESGRILLDDIDLRDYRLRDLRNQFAMVLQEPILFSSSIADNIAYGRPHATHEQIVQAACDANAHDFITGLPNGYESEVGERGMRLSGGERQRISIARAFLKDAPVLLLDEPTSALDSGTEELIIQAMERLMQNRTVFIIAHRLDTLRNCDIRLELEGSAVRVMASSSQDG